MKKEYLIQTLEKMVDNSQNIAKVKVKIKNGDKESKKR